MAKEGIKALEAEKSLPLTALAPPNAAARHSTPTFKTPFLAISMRMFPGRKGKAVFPAVDHCDQNSSRRIVFSHQQR
jgi:hypothetical protein